MAITATALGQPKDRDAAMGPREPTGTGYVIVLDETAAGKPYQQAGDALAKLRAPSMVVPLGSAGLGPVFQTLAGLHPRLVAFVVPPERIEDNFVGEVFERASRLVAGPELDFAYGFITGATGADALALVQNTARAEKERQTIARKFVAVGHTFREADLGAFAREQAQFFERYGYRCWPINPIDNSADWQQRQAREMRQLDGASLVLFAGHGMGDWMCGMDAATFSGFQLDRAIVISGPCHSAVTTLRHDVTPGTLGVKAVAIAPERSICLKLIHAGAVAQVGSTASSSWMNVGPVIPGFFHEAQTLGEALRDRLNQHIRQNRLGQFSILPFEEGKPSPQFLPEERNPAGIQSLARVVLIGDPAYRPFPQKQPVLRDQRMAERSQPTKPGGAPATSAGSDITQLIQAMTTQSSPDFAELNAVIQRGKAAVPPLLEALKTSDSWLVPKALGAIQDARAVDPLIEALQRRNWSPYREVAGEALEQITGQKLGVQGAAWKAWRETTRGTAR